MRKFKSANQILIELHVLLYVKSKIERDAGDYIKIMAIEEGYIMARNTGCTPGIWSVRDFVIYLQVHLPKDHTNFELINNFNFKR